MDINSSKRDLFCVPSMKCQTLLGKAIQEHFTKPAQLASVFSSSPSLQNSSAGANFLSNFKLNKNTSTLFLTVFTPEDCFSFQFSPSASPRLVTMTRFGKKKFFPSFRNSSKIKNTSKRIFARSPFTLDLSTTNNFGVRTACTFLNTGRVSSLCASLRRSSFFLFFLATQFLAVCFLATQLMMMPTSSLFFQIQLHQINNNNNKDDYIL
jgi:hypothetical protein